jgi:hypothetical protein
LDASACQTSQAFDRKAIQDALEGFPDVEQSAFPRDIRNPRQHIPCRGPVTPHPVNRELIKKQIKRGLPLGGETFYGSLYPIKQAVLEAGMPAEKFDQWIHSLAPASARNSIINETAVGQFLRDMKPVAFLSLRRTSLRRWRHTSRSLAWA